MNMLLCQGFISYPDLLKGFAVEDKRLLSAAYKHSDSKARAQIVLYLSSPGKQVARRPREAGEGGIK